MEDLPPNHHAEYKQFSGIFGYLGALSMSFGRTADAEVVTELADLNNREPGAHVLDVGCGPGTAARIAAATGAKVTALDPSGPMLRVGRLISRIMRKGTDISWVEAGAEDLGLPAESVDVYWSLAAVHHWPDLDAGLTEAFRVLKPGGVFLGLEKRTQPGADGNASHGWTAQQAELLASMLPNYGFRDAEVSNHDRGKRELVVVKATK